MIRLAIETVLILAGFGAGWYCKGKFGAVADKVNQDLGNPVK